MLKLSTFIFCIIYHFGQKNIVSVVVFSLGNLYRTGWSVFSAFEIGFECEFCIKKKCLSILLLLEKPKCKLQYHVVKCQ